MPDNPPAVAPADADADAIRIDAASIPTLPDSAARVIALVGDPRLTTSSLALAIAGDPALSAALLRLANSSDYASGADVSSVRESIMRVGALAVRNLAVTHGLSALISNRSVYGDRGRALFDHSLGTALLARLIADEAGEAPDHGFLCGLLHDAGKIVLLKRQHETPAAADAPEAERSARLEAGRHGEIGAMTIRRWGLPAEFEPPVRWHHDPASAVEGRRMAAVVYLANRLSHGYGFGCEPEAFDAAADPVVRELGIDADWLADLDARARGLFEAARAGVADALRQPD